MVNKQFLWESRKRIPFGTNCILNTWRNAGENVFIHLENHCLAVASALNK